MVIVKIIIILIMEVDIIIKMLFKNNLISIYILRRIIRKIRIQIINLPLLIKNIANMLAKGKEPLMGKIRMEKQKKSMKKA